MICIFFLCDIFSSFFKKKELIGFTSFGLICFRTCLIYYTFFLYAAFSVFTYCISTVFTRLVAAGSVGTKLRLLNKESELLKETK